MLYLHCPRCHLEITSSEHELPPSNCPRCLATSAISPLFSSQLDSTELRAAYDAAPS